MNMEIPNAGGAKDFQVTGVSRSGRVRKKSSKLLDFQSPDEVDKKPKRSPKTPTRAIRGKPILSESSWKRQLLADISVSPGSIEVPENSDLWKPEGIGIDDKTYNERNVNITRVDDDDELDELVADIVEGVEAEAENATESMVRQSLYMTEKANKKKVLKDGRVVTERTQRRDKGKTRLTAYSMWVREQRKSINIGIKWDSDATNNAHRLSEMWANVSNNEKNVWRRKAKRVAISSERTEADGVANTTVATTSSAFLNRATTSRTRKLAAAKLMTSPDTKMANKHTTQLTATIRGRKDMERHLCSIDGSPHRSSSNAPATNTVRHSCQEANSPTCSKSVADSDSVPMSGIAPIDAAAHLKLLGESLSIIGERLKEHEGQITVSGSLSVLLDSLLCSIGPLMCLATCIPGLDKHKDLNDNLAATLDNIAYVMPGL